MGNGDRVSQREKLRLRCDVIAEVVRALAPIHSTCAHSTQADLLETLIGASIWYLPTLTTELWTGTISIGAIESCSPSRGTGRVKLSQEHVVPRKIAACRLLSHPDRTNADFARSIERMYLEELGKFRYVTATENKRLVAFQKKGKYTNSDAAYQQAKIVFITTSSDELRQLRKRDETTIRLLIARNRTGVSDLVQ